MYEELLEPMLAGLAVSLINRFVINNPAIWNCCNNKGQVDEQVVEIKKKDARDDSSEDSGPVITTAASDGSMVHQCSSIPHMHIFHHG